MNKATLMSINQKENLRLRMVDLEKKLAESEEERNKLEKTCNALMKSFKEKERTRYIALSKKYEKFLQDCSVRKRRNDIILRSLCRIEDRSRALFAKTERLKLLKDRYISYLKINDVKKDEVSSQLLETFSLATSSQKTTDSVNSKSVHWKIPLTTDKKKEKLKEIGDVVWCNRASGVFPDVTSTDLENSKQGRSDEIYRFEDSRNSAGIVLNESFKTEAPAVSTTIQNKLNLATIGLDFCESLAEPLFIQQKSEKLFRDNDCRKPENDCTSKNETSNGKLEVGDLSEISGSVTSRQKSVEKVEKALSSKDEYSKNKNNDKKLYSNDGKIIGRLDIEASEKDLIRNPNNLQDELHSRVNYRFLPLRSNSVTHDAENHENVAENSGKEMKTDYQEKVPNDFQSDNTKSLPMGMDGVDYQNETYPESYYEQPVYHHNHTNIAADVILEEDETEENVEEEEEDLTADPSFIKAWGFHGDDHESSTWVHSPGREILNETYDTMNKVHAADKNSCEDPNDQIKNEKYDSEKTQEAKQSDLGVDEPKRNRSENLVPDKSDRNRTPIRSNLIHLLESDSESFQIEHGDGVSENEDSDFDLSFK